MSRIVQLDMFAAAAKAPAAVPPVKKPPQAIAPAAPKQERATLADIRGVRCVAWTRLLDSISDDLPELRIVVTANWTGEVVEVLSHATIGRKFLHQDGLITDRPADTQFYLIVFQKPDAARLLHVRHGLVPIGPHGTIGARFRLASPDEHVPATLSLPEGM